LEGHAQMQSLNLGNQERTTKSVLLVDDDPGVRLSCMIILRHAGFDVYATASADEAHKAWQAAVKPFDLLVTDFNMPGLTGVELAESLRTLKADLGIVLISGLSVEEVQPPEGMVFLQKPFAYQTFIDTVSLCQEKGCRFAECHS